MSTDCAALAGAIPRTTGDDAAATPREHSHVLIEYLGVASVLIQLVLAALVVRKADLLSPAFRRIVYLATAGFVMHHLLPLRYRLRVFAMLCGLALLIVMGGSPDKLWDGTLALQRSLPILATGGILTGICVLPISFWGRAAMLAVAGGVLALFRAGLIGTPPLALVWPVLAAMFMFRAIVFLYEVPTLKQRPTLAEAFAYFFLLPTSAVGLFPVVDYKAFSRSHYDSDALTIYQRGVGWIVRGVSQLMVYRLIQQLLAIKPEDVTNGKELIQFILTNAFLYVRVSGQFHLFVGLLLLFGFNLPETNRRYFLASSFTDYWRRVNIYWKDFILTVFYYPTYFRLKKQGATYALVVATLWSFFVTWALHLYQTWWLKGSAPMTWPDALFWLILALLVLVNALWEMKRGRQRKLASSSYSVRGALGLALRTAATFSCISVLWSLWSTPSVSQWLGLWRFADRNTAMGAVVTLAGIMLATIAFEVLPTAWTRAAGAGQVAASPAPPFGRSFAWSVSLLVVIYALGTQTLQARLDYAALQPWHDAISTGDSMMDELVVRNGGYYERLMTADPADAQRFETMMQARMPPVYQGEDPIRPLRDFRFREFIPNVHLQAYDTDFSTNRWGMRDRDYEQAKPPGTLRIALLGSSHTMGWGVRNDEVFEAIVEQRLNEERPAGSARIEILNFAQNGLSPLGDISMLQQRVGAFKPDIVLLVTHPIDYKWLNRDLSRSLREHVPIPYDFLNDILRDARITARTHEVLASRRLEVYEPALLAWSYERVAEEIRKMGALPVAMFVPTPIDLPIKTSKAGGGQTALVTKAGFVLLDFTDVFHGQRIGDLTVQDGHSNARAHALIADALQARLLTDPTIDLANRTRLAARTASAQSPATQTSR